MQGSGDLSLSDWFYVYIGPIYFVAMGVMIIGEVLARGMGVVELDGFIPLAGRMNPVGALLEIVSGTLIAISGGLVFARKAFGVKLLVIATICYAGGLFLNEVLFQVPNPDEVQYLEIIIGSFLIWIVMGVFSIRSGVLR